MSGQAPPAIRRGPVDRLTLLADAAYFALQLERKLTALIDVERDERRFRAWTAGARIARRLRQLLLAERKRHRDRVTSNRQRARRREGPA